MKVLFYKFVIRFMVLLGIGLAPFSSAYAHDSFSFGFNIGGYGAPPVVRYYSAPPLVYYGEPTAYYRPVPRGYFFAGRSAYGYRHYDHGSRYYGRGWDNDDYRGHQGGWRRDDDDRRGHR